MHIYLYRIVLNLTKIIDCNEHYNECTVKRSKFCLYF